MKDFDRISFGQYEFSQEECPLKAAENGRLMKEKDIIYVNSGLCKELSIATNGQIKRRDDSVAFKIYK